MNIVDAYITLLIFFHGPFLQLDNEPCYRCHLNVMLS